MANARGQEIDNTSLTVDNAERKLFLHRDYLAHAFRWNHVLKYLTEQRRYKTHHVLDVGCGKELPLAKAMFSNMLTHTTGSFTAVDINKLARPDTIADRGKFNLVLHGKTNLLEAVLERPTYDTVVCFEVLEHVEPLMSWELLVRMRELLDPGGLAFVSTPCYDRRIGAAANHVNEMTYHAFWCLLLLAGWKVQNSFGTFASRRDYKQQLSPAQREVFKELEDYYHSQVLACIFAPLFPAHSRNALWLLEVGPPGELPLTKEELLDPSCSSSARWVGDLKKILR